MFTMSVYSARCRNCRYSRQFGNAPITARTKATVHALHKGHIVDISVTDMVTLTTTVETVPSSTPEGLFP